MKRFVIVETLRGVSETIFVFHEGNLGRQQIYPEKHNILVFLSNTLFPPFYVPSPSLFPISENGRYLGGTWEVLGRNVFVLPSLLLCFPIDTKAKFYRRQSEVLSKTYRTPIEDLSNIYRTPIEDLSKRVCVNCFIHLHMVCLMRRRMGISPCIFFLTNGSSVRSLLRKSGASGMVPYTS